MRSRVLLIGDVGPVDGIFHVGDEAMLERAIEELRARDWQTMTVISANPEDTSRRYDVDSVSRDAFTTGDAASRAQALEQVLDEVELVVVAGGGNLNDIWTEHTALRLLVCEAAASLNIDVVVTGQGLGPFQSVEGANNVRRILETARVVGVRDAQSHALCVEWGLPAEKVFLRPDDAQHRLSQASFSPVVLPDGSAPEEFVVASFSEWHGELSTPEEHLHVCVRLVEDLHAITNLPVLLVPQEGSLTGEHVLDVAFHDRIEAQLGTGVATSLDITSTTGCRQVIRASNMVLSSRYHPVVFAMAEAVPAVGVVVDHYTHAKLSHALTELSPFGVTIPTPLFHPEDAREAIALVWSRRDDISSALAESQPELREYDDDWWDYVAEPRNSSHLHRLVNSSLRRLARPTHVGSADGGTVMRLTRASAAMARLARRLWEAKSGMITSMSSLESQLAKTVEYAQSLESSLATAIDGEQRTQKYAKSLEAHLATAIDGEQKAQIYARSLEAHFADSQEQVRLATSYARSLEEELTKKNLQGPSQ